MNKNTVYILQKDYEYPNGKVYKGVGHTIKEWQRYFPYLIGRDFDIKTDWFKPKEEVNESKPTEQFIWTDELVKEFTLGAIKVQNSLPNEVSLDRGIYHFKKEKSKKEEPQWEILAYNNPNVFTDVLGGNIVDAKGSGANYAILKNFPIHSVKRFPDNAVWSVGQLTEHGKISAFRITGGIMHVELIDSKYPLTFLYLSQLEAPKEEQVPIKVEIMEFGYGKPQENKGKFYVANFNLPNNAKLPTEKYQSIKSAIEDVLNEDKIKHEKLLSKIESKVRLANMINTQVNYLKETLDYINSLK